MDFLDGLSFQDCIAYVWDRGLGRKEKRGTAWTRQSLQDALAEVVIELAPPKKENLAAITVQLWKKATNRKPSTKKVYVLTELIRGAETREIYDYVCQAIEAAVEKIPSQQRGRLPQHDQADMMASIVVRKLTEKLVDAQDKPLLIIGPTYVDISIEDVAHKSMSRDVEHTSATHKEPTLGGSGVKFAKIWHNIIGEPKSNLITSVAPKSSLLGNIQRTLLGQASYIHKLYPSEATQGPPLSVILNHSGGIAATTITSKIGADGLKWESIRNTINDELKPNLKTILLTGLEKTDLYSELVPHLEELNRGFVIVLDIGRLDPLSDEVKSRDPIRSAIDLGVIDLCFGRYMELLRVGRHAMPQTEKSKYEIRPRVKKLNSLAKGRNSKQGVCILRDFHYPAFEKAKANGEPEFVNELIQIVILVGKNVFDLTDELPKEKYVGGRFSTLARTFDARVLSQLISLANSSTVIGIADLKNAVINAAERTFVSK